MNELNVLVPPPRETLQQRIYEELRGALMRGEFTPGRPLTIRALANALQTSSMPVREALRQLVTERALEMLANRSFGVPRLNSDKYRDLLRVRVELEGYAAAEAARRITNEDLRRLGETNEAMRSAGDRGDRVGFITGNMEFHFTVYRAAGSSILMPLIETLWLQAGPYMGCLYNDGLDPIVNLGHHDGLIKALRRKDPEKSRAMLAADITTPAERIIELANARFAASSSPASANQMRRPLRSPGQLASGLSKLRGGA